MKFAKTKVIVGALLMGGLVTPAHADIEDWLRNTFSGRDVVGDWLRDTFGPVHNSGTGSGSPDINLVNYKEAALIMNEWEKPREVKSAKSPVTVRRICSDETLLSVVAATKSQELTKEICFKTTTATGKALPATRAARPAKMRASKERMRAN